MNVEKRETYASGSSDAECVDSGAEESNVAAATIPKKRGRPAKSDKVEKKPPSGRGRGRPKTSVAEGSEDSDTAVENGGKKPTGVRGRPAKNGAHKPIVASGKGRGRPKNPTKRAADDAEESLPNKAVGGKRGRPRKAAQASDEEGN